MPGGRHTDAVALVSEPPRTGPSDGMVMGECVDDIAGEEAQREPAVFEDAVSARSAGPVVGVAGVPHGVDGHPAGAQDTTVSTPAAWKASVVDRAMHRSMWAYAASMLRPGWSTGSRTSGTGLLPVLAGSGEV